MRQADVTDLPFEDATFTLMFSQHVQMNVADKALLYQEARRVLVNGGRLAVWDIVAGEDREPGFPLPWADRPEYSHLTTSDRLRTAIETAGFEIEQWNDLTDQAAATMQALLTLPPSPIGLRAFVPNFEPKAKNLTTALADGRLRRPGRRMSDLRRAAIRSARTRTMRSKIVMIGAGCAPTRRARPATHPRRAGNPRERLRAVGPAVCPADGPAATTAAASGGVRRQWSRRPVRAGTRRPAASLTRTRATAILSASPGRAA